jgi:hypothetical protein
LQVAGAVVDGVLRRVESHYWDEISSKWFEIPYLKFIPESGLLSLGYSIYRREIVGIYVGKLPILR